MAFAGKHAGTSECFVLSNAGSTTNSTSITGNYTQAGSVGDLVLACLASDNVQTTDGTSTLHSTLTDNAGNTYTKIHEYTIGKGASNGGATCSLWRCTLTNAVTTSNTITFALTLSKTAKCGVGCVFTNSGGAVSVAGTPQVLANSVADPGSMSLSGLSSKEYIFFRGIASETNSTALMTATAGFQRGHDVTSGGGSAANMRAGYEWDIDTATGSTSDPTFSNLDHASIFIAVEAAAGSGGFAYSQGFMLF